MQSTIREAAPHDAAALAAIYAPSVSDAPTSFELEPPGGDEMERRRAAYQWCVDTSVYVRADATGRGIGRALYRALLPLLVLQGFRAAHAGVTLPNPASVRLHESFGFQPVGVFAKTGWKMGAWH